MKIVKLIIACIVLMLVPIAAAQASTGTITRAAIDPTRTIAVITGSVTSPPGSTVVIDERPSLPSYTCKVDDWKSSDPNIKRVISGITDGFFSFNRSIALLAPGMVDLRLCITVVQQFDEQDPVCVAQAPDPATCPLISRIVSEVVATTLFTVQPQPTFTPPSGVPPHETPVIPVPSVLPVPKLTASQAKAAANSYFKHHYRSFRRGSKRSITTRKVSKLVRTAAVKWTYKHKRHSKRATITKTGTSVRVTR